jgi:putative DNA primase/helicase
VIAGSNGRIVALENLSHIPQWLSDALCRIATGSGFATRELYADADEAIFSVQLPVTLNGIVEVVIAGDLQDRSIVLTLPTIEEYASEDDL